jgi:hypothetical protein
MAFNPFHWFRKHQRMLIAVVTIFIMFLFVLTGFRGGLDETFRGFSGKDRSPVVTTINGTQIREGEVAKVSQSRKMASDFLRLQAFENHNKVLTDLMQKDLKGGDAGAVLDPYARLRRIASNTQRRQSVLQFLQFQRLGRDALIGALGNQLNQLHGDLQALEDLGSDPQFVKNDSDRLELLGKVGTILGFQLWLFETTLARLEGRPMTEDLYYGGSSKRIDDTLDFMMWKAQADKLGIKLTNADVAREINREAAGAEVFAKPDKLDVDKDTTIQKFLTIRDYSASNPKELMEALRDELQVVMAQGILLGFEPGVRAYRSLMGASASPAAVTPDEFLNFYREYRTALKVMMMPVSAEKFLAKVTQEPTEAELRARYDKFREKEALPYSRDPGFKEPRRVVVQYIVGDAGHSYYRDAARKLARAYALHAEPNGRAGRVFGAAAGAPSHLGAGPLAPMASLLAPLALDPLGREYDRYLDDHAPWLPLEMRELLTPGERESVQLRLERKFRLASVSVPQTVAATVGGWTGGPLVGLSSLYTTATGFEVRGAVRQTAGVILASSDFQNLFGTAALAVATNPAPLPYERVEPMFLSALQERLARDLVRSHLDTISREITRLKKQPKEVEEYLEKALKEYPALKLVTMPAPKSELVMADELDRKIDLKVGDLLSAFQKKLLVQRERDFVSVLFMSQGTFDPQRVRMPGMFPGMDDTESEFDRIEVLWWRKEDLPARVRPFDAVRDEVARAWKLDRARVLARQEAEKMADEIDGKKWTPADGPISPTTSSSSS